MPARAGSLRQRQRDRLRPGADAVLAARTAACPGPRPARRRRRPRSPPIRPSAAPSRRRRCRPRPCAPPPPASPARRPPRCAPPWPSSYRTSRRCSPRTGRAAAAGASPAWRPAAPGRGRASSPGSRLSSRSRPASAPFTRSSPMYSLSACIANGPLRYPAYGSMARSSGSPVRMGGHGLGSRMILMNRRSRSRPPASSTTCIAEYQARLSERTMAPSAGAYRSWPPHHRCATSCATTSNTTSKPLPPRVQQEEPLSPGDDAAPVDPHPHEVAGLLDELQEAVRVGAEPRGVVVQRRAGAAEHAVQVRGVRRVEEDRDLHALPPLPVHRVVGGEEHQLAADGDVAGVVEVAAAPLAPGAAQRARRDGHLARVGAHHRFEDGARPRGEVRVDVVGRGEGDLPRETVRAPVFGARELAARLVADAGEQAAGEVGAVGDDACRSAGAAASRKPRGS